VHFRDGQLVPPDLDPQWTGALHEHKPQP